MVLSVWSVLGYYSVVRLVRLGCHGVVGLVDFGLSWCCPLSLYGRFWVVMVLSAWSVLGRHGVVRLFWVVTVLSVWSDVRCHGVVCLGSFGLSRCCLFCRFWVVMVLSAWSALVVLGFELFLWYCLFGPLGCFWVVMVLSVWSILDCHGVVCLVRLGGFRLSRYSIYSLNVII